MNKDFWVTTISIFVVVFVGMFTALYLSPNKPLGEASPFVFYTSPTQATSSVGLYTPVNLLAGAGSRQYANICNTSPTSTNDLMLEFDATSTVLGLNAPAVVIPGNSCYELTPNKMFTGALYGIFTTNTATVTTLFK